MTYTLRDGKIGDPITSDIEIIETSSSVNRAIHTKSSNDTVKCGICSLNLNNFSVAGRQQHCESHFPESSFPSSHLLSRSADKSSFKILNGKRKQIRDDDVFWHSSQSRDPPSNYTPGLMFLLRKALLVSQSAGMTRRAVLCYNLTTHVCCTSWDRTWGCGYRNFLMACTALMDQPMCPMYAHLLGMPLAPGVCNLQAWIEDAWSAGFDKQGAKELKKLVGSNKWIGTADLWVAFIYRGIPAELVDFNLQHEAQGAKIVVDWIVNYFSAQLESTKPDNVHDALLRASPIVFTKHMPLILQHNGHSRIIVGYEVTKNGKVTLLTFDPSKKLDRDARQNALSLWSQLSSPQLFCGPSKESNKIRKRSKNESISSARLSLERARPVAGEVINLSDNEDGDITIEDLQDSTLNNHPRETPGINYYKLLGKFRLNSKKLGKKEYQILYFPMTEPLTNKQRMASKTVVSTRIC